MRRLGNQHLITCLWLTISRMDWRIQPSTNLRKPTTNLIIRLIFRSTPLWARIYGLSNPVKIQTEAVASLSAVNWVKSSQSSIIPTSTERNALTSSKSTVKNRCSTKTESLIFVALPWPPPLMATCKAFSTRRGICVQVAVSTTLKMCKIDWFIWQTTLCSRGALSTVNLKMETK